MSLKGKNVRVRGPWWHYQFEARGQIFSGTTGLEGIESNRSAAEQFAARKRREILHPEIASIEDERRKPFDVAAGEFSTWARDVEYRARPATAARLKGSMTSCVMFFGDRPVCEIGAAELEAYKEFRIRRQGVRDVTLRHDLHALSKLFQYAKKRKLVESNPVKEVKIPSDRDAIREHVVTPAEEGTYLATALRLYSHFRKNHPKAQPNMHDLAVLMLEQGARPEELCSVRKASVDVAAGKLRIEGGKSRAARRTLDLTVRSQAVVERRMASEGPWLFPSDRYAGRHITKLQGTHDRICLDAGLSFVIYDLRHTWATRMVEAGNDVPTVAAIMGHSGLRTIYRYVHPTAEAKKAAMERFQAAARRRGIKVVGK